MVNRPPLRHLVKAELDVDGPALRLDDSIERAASVLAAKRSPTGRVMQGDRYVGAVTIFDLVSALLPPETGDEAEGAESSPVVLRFRKIGESQDMLAELESLADAKTWLAERPKFVRVLRVESPDLPSSVEAELHDVMRPLDDEELEALAEAQRKLQELHSIELRDLQAQAERETTSRASRSPSRPFALRYQKGQVLVHADADDDRPIPDGVRRAVEAWVERRNEWLHPRRQHVGVAVLSVPATLEGIENLADAVQIEGEVEVVSGVVDE
jgi:hypothetical protein